MKCIVCKIGSEIVLVLLCLFIASCGTSSSDGSLTIRINAELISFPTGASLPNNFQNAMVVVKNSINNNSISTAVVKINNTTLTYNVINGEYEGIVILAPQETVSLNVTVGDRTISASGIQPANYPHLTAPSTGDIWSSGGNYNIKFTGSVLSTGEVYAVGVLNAAEPNGSLVWPANSSFKVINGGAAGDVSYFMPSYSLSAGSRIALAGIVKTIPIPDADSDSNLILGGFNYAPFTVN